MDFFLVGDKKQNKTKEMGFKGYLSLQLKLIWVELDWAGAKVDQYQDYTAENISQRNITKNFASEIIVKLGE